MKSKEKATARKVNKINKELERIVATCIELNMPYEAAVMNVVKYLKEIPGEVFYEMAAHGAIEAIADIIAPNEAI